MCVYVPSSYAYNFFGGKTAQVGVEGADDTGKGSEHDSNDIQVQDIDAYWLQREITKAVTAMDANEAQNLAEKVLSALAKGIKKGGACSLNPFSITRTTTIVIVIVTITSVLALSEQMQWTSTTKTTNEKWRIAWFIC